MLTYTLLLQTPEEFATVTNRTPEHYSPSNGLHSLDDLVQVGALLLNQNPTG